MSKENMEQDDFSESYETKTPETVTALSTELLPDGYHGPAIYCQFNELRETNSLTPNPKNPNKHPRKQLTYLGKILSGNGWRSPIVVSRQSGMIVKGEGRWQAATLGGFSHIPVDVQNYDSYEHELADLVADNEIQKMAEMDKQKRFSILEELDVGSIDLEITGIPLSELEEMFNESRQDEDKVLYPMAAKLHEKYDYVMIFTDNETDRQHLYEISGIRKEVSYKMSKNVGMGRAIPFMRFLEGLKKYNMIKEKTTDADSDSFDEQGGDSPYTQIAE